MKHIKQARIFKIKKNKKQLKRNLKMYTLYI